MYLDNQLYHVYNRGAHRLNIFRSDFQYRYCLDLLKKYRTQYQIDISAYCLMPNHFHFLLRQQEGGSISRFIQTTFNAYVQAFNKMEEHSGTIFQGAAKSTPVETDEHLYHLVAYIHFNPVKARLTRKLELWEFSDYRQWIGLHPFLFDGNDLRESLFKVAQPEHGNLEKASLEYHDFMKTYQEEKVFTHISKYLLD
jgi:putative transposase